MYLAIAIWVDDNGESHVLSRQTKLTDPVAVAEIFKKEVPLMAHQLQKILLIESDIQDPIQPGYQIPAIDQHWTKEMGDF